MNFYKKKALVCGLARSGYAAAMLLRSLGADVCVSELSERESFKPEKEDMARRLEQAGVTLFLGANPAGVSSGFDLIVISPGIPFDLPFLNDARQKGIPVWGELELGYSVCACPIVAITGTNGKTTASTIAGQIMKGFRSASETMGNIGTAFCEKAAVIPRDAFCVLEVSSFQLETIHHFRPRIAAVLNITEDHLNRHKTFENYVRIKERIFENQTAGDRLILNYDDSYCRDMAARAKSRVSYFSSRGDMPGAAEGVFLSDGSVFYKNGAYYDKIIDISEMRTPFRHITEDAMAAALIGLLAGAPKELVRKTIASFTGVSHRVEFVASVDGADYYNDSKATNVDAAVKALNAVDGPVVLIGGGQDKEADFSAWVKYFPGKVRHLAVFGETAGKIIDTCENFGFTEYTRVNSLREAVLVCRKNARPGDAVLLSPACASLDMFENYEERGDVFREIVTGML